MVKLISYFIFSNDFARLYFPMISRLESPTSADVDELCQDFSYYFEESC